MSSLLCLIKHYLPETTQTDALPDSIERRLIKQSKLDSLLYHRQAARVTRMEEW